MLRRITVKIIKNLFGTKQKQNHKYEPNTLAEINGSPDLRLATAKEKEVDIPLPKSDEVKKISKGSSKGTKKSTSAKSSQSKKITKKTENVTEKDQTVKDVKTATKSTSTTKPAANKSTSKTTTANKEATVKETKKTSAPKSGATKTAKESTATKTKTTASTIKKAPANDPVKKAEAKPTAAKKTAATTVKKVESAPKKAESTSQKTASKTTPSSTKPVAAKPTSKAKVETQKKAVKDTAAEEITVSKATRSGKFEIKKSKDGRFVFNLYASNNVIVATSQVYSSSTSAMNGIKSVIANASSAPIEDQSLKKVTPVPFPKWEIYLDKGEQYRFRLCASNGSCVCHSQGYTTKTNCKKGIESIIKFASDAEITKVYLDKKEK